MDDLCMEHSAHERAITRHDARLDGHSAQLDELRDCVTRLTALQEQDAEWRSEAEKRIEALEGKPTERWDAIARTTLTAVVAGVVGMALAGVGING